MIVHRVTWFPPDRPVEGNTIFVRQDALSGSETAAPAHHPTPTPNAAHAATGHAARAVWARRHRRIRLHPPAEPRIVPAPVHADRPASPWWWVAPVYATNTARSIR